MANEKEVNGGSSSSKQHEVYNDAFPTLGGAPAAKNPMAAFAKPSAKSFASFSNQKKKGAAAPRGGASNNSSGTVQRSLTIPANERHQTGRVVTSEIRTQCQEVMRATKTKIEYSINKDDSLYIIVQGRPEGAVADAVKQIRAKLQRQGERQLNIPKEFHRFILGKGGEKLRSLESSTSTNIRVPGPNSQDIQISVKGPKQGIDQAIAKINEIVAMQANRAVEVIDIPWEFHGFIRGGNDARKKEFEKSAGGKCTINIPPPTKRFNEGVSSKITIQGDKACVKICAAMVNELYNKKKGKLTEVSVDIPQSQHRYIIGTRGAGIQEILQKHDVIVDIPKKESNSDTLTLRGEPQHLGPALNEVYMKANSVTSHTLSAPKWVRPRIIGAKGVEINALTSQFPGVQIEFKDGSDKIEISGPLEAADAVLKVLTAKVKDITTNVAVKEIRIPSQFHPQIIGKGGANVNDMKKRFGGLSIRVPNADEKSDVVSIEGRPDQVQLCFKELTSMATRFADEKQEVLKFESKYHPAMIGQGGKVIAPMREKYPAVNINFPEQSKKKNEVSVRGPSKQVDAIVQDLNKLYKEIVSNAYYIDLPIMKQYHKNIIGKGGETIRKIREDLNVKIDLPGEDDDSDLIKITGKKLEVDQARKRIRAIEAEQANIAEEAVKIDPKLHKSLIGAKGKYVRQLMKECGVYIQFPDNGDEVLIRGPADDVAAAKIKLLEDAKTRQEESFTADVACPQQCVRFLIGKNGKNIRETQAKFSVRIIPPETNSDDDKFTILGKDANVKNAQKYLIEEVEKLKAQKEEVMTITKAFHKHFLGRGARVCNDLRDEFGGVNVRFSKEKDSEEVTVQGPVDCVDACVVKIKSIVDDLENQDQIEFEIENKYHRTVIGKGGEKVRAVESDYNVSVKFPKFDDPEMKDSNIVKISGHKNKIEEAKAALLALVPITEEFVMPFEFHRLIIGQRGDNIRKLQQELDVKITVPKEGDEGDKNVITLSGNADKLELAKVAFEEKKKEYMKDIEDIYLRSYKVELSIPSLFHSKLIGRQGSEITNLRQKFDVNIQFPKREAEGDDKDKIIIIGYMEAANAAAEYMQGLATGLQAHVSKDVEIDHRTHSRIIGGRGRGVRRLMDEYGVEIRFPKSTPGMDEDAKNVITVTGNDQKVDDAITALTNLEEEFLQDILGEDAEDAFDSQYKPKLAGQVCLQGEEENTRGKPRGKPAKRGNANNASYTVTGAPWQQNDGDSNQQFPGLGPAPAGPSGESNIAMGAWNARM